MDGTGEQWIALQIPNLVFSALGQFCADCACSF